MNKIILIFAILLFSTGTYAKAKNCDEGSLKGRYGYEMSGVNEFPIPPTFTTKVSRSTHQIGHAFFDGNGNFDITGYGTAAGSMAERTGNGTYSVNSDDCTAEGMMTWNTGETSEFRMVLDRTNVRVVVATYGKTALGTYPSSESGTLTKFVGRFH
jgi:hypothetical protein